MDADGKIIKESKGNRGDVLHQQNDRSNTMLVKQKKSFLIAYAPGLAACLLDYDFDTYDLKKDIPELQVTVKELLENRTDKRPLALFVGVSDPHVRWPSESTVDPETMSVPPQLVDTPRTRVQRSRYLQQVKNVDAYLGELRELTDKHLSKDKLFVFSSDHGAQFPFGKWTLYDEGIRVPLHRPRGVRWICSLQFLRNCE
jgi:hypothetical protein